MEMNGANYLKKSWIVILVKYQYRWKVYDFTITQHEPSLQATIIKMAFNISDSSIQFGQELDK